MILLVDPEKRDFDAALKVLSGLITQRKRADGSNWGDAFAVMHDYIKVLELQEPIAQLKVIHVAGTKGKGSTCAFSEHILREGGQFTGLFTSPHLVNIRERIRLNGDWVSEDVFLEHFWWCMDRLLEASSKSGLRLPPYFRFLTLLALRIFTQLKVDVAILEVGIGGRYDATNIVSSPTVCGVASLGFDHMELLGNTLGQIAGEKAGIFKKNVPAITVPQEEEAMRVLKARAKEVGAWLTVVEPSWKLLEGLRLGLAGDHQRVNAVLAIALCREWERTWRQSGGREVGGGGGDAGEEEFYSGEGGGKLPEHYRRGLEKTFWPGRGQIVHDPVYVDSESGRQLEDVFSRGLMAEGGGLERSELVGRGPEDSSAVPLFSGVSFYLDGAHTPESMEVCAEWFCKAVGEERKKREERVNEQRASEGGVREGNSGGNAEKVSCFNESSVKRILLFNCMPERDPTLLLSRLLSGLDRHGLPFHRALFVPSLSSYTSVGTHQSPLSAASSPPSPLSILPTIPVLNPPSSPARQSPPRAHPRLGVQSMNGNQQAGAGALEWQCKIQMVWVGLMHLRASAALLGRSSPTSSPVAAASSPPHSSPLSSCPSTSFIRNAAELSTVDLPQLAAPGSATENLINGGSTGGIEGGEGHGPEHGHVALREPISPTSMVMSSIPAAIDFLRKCARESPPIRIQVLVTGSLHLVGDVLKVLRR